MSGVKGAILGKGGLGRGAGREDTLTWPPPTPMNKQAQAEK